MQYVPGDIPMDSNCYVSDDIPMDRSTILWDHYASIIMDIDVMNRQQQCVQGYITSHNFSSGVDYSLLWISTA